MSESLPFPVRAGEFEGPMDLLLALARRHEVRLEEIPLAQVTSQYLAYMRQAGELNVELGSEFIYMSATLIDWKSRLLLPRHPELEAISPQPDPQKQFVDRLREHEMMKSGVSFLSTMQTLEQSSFSSPSIGQYAPDSAGPVEYGRKQATLADLIDTLQEAIRRTKSRIVIEQEPSSVEDRIRWLRARLSSSDGELPASVLFREQDSLTDRAYLFLGMLEMTRDRETRLEQSELFGEMHVGRR